MLGWIFAASQIATLCWLFTRGWYRTAPLFLCCLALSSWQALAANFASLYSRAWWQATWMPVERWHVVFAVMASCEILWRQTAGLEPVERRGLRVGVPLIAAAVVLLLWRAETERYEAFLHTRELSWVMCSVLLVCLMLFGIVKSVPGSAHRWLFGLWMLAHAGIAPLINLTAAQWLDQRMVYRSIVIALCVGWTLTAGASAVVSPVHPSLRRPAANR